VAAEEAQSCSGNKKQQQRRVRDERGHQRRVLVLLRLRSFAFSKPLVFSFYVFFNFSYFLFLNLGSFFWSA
jgi:hypothetical protein